MEKNMKYIYVIGFTLMTLFGVYYYKGILFNSANITPSKPPTDSVTLIDEPVTIERRFHIEGMHCAKCQSKIESAVKTIGGVKDVSVNLKDKQMRVIYFQNQEAIQETLQAVNELGYTAGLKSQSGNIQVLDFKVRVN